MKRIQFCILTGNENENSSPTDQILSECMFVFVMLLIASSLPHVAEGRPHAAHADGLREQALWYSTYQTKPEINILFAVCRVLN